MALHSAAMFKQSSNTTHESAAHGDCSQLHNQQQQRRPNANCSRALLEAAATGSSLARSPSASCSSSSTASSPSPPSVGPTNDHHHRQSHQEQQDQRQRAALAAATTRERLTSALLLHQQQVIQQQQQQQQQQQALSLASSSGSLNEDDPPTAIRLTLFKGTLQRLRDYEALTATSQEAPMDEDSKSSNSSTLIHAYEREQETALNLSVSKRSQPEAGPKVDLNHQLNLRDQQQHAQLEQRQQQFQQASGRLYDHLLACQAQQGGGADNQQHVGRLLIAAALSPDGSSASSFAASPPAPALANFAHLMQHQNQHQHHDQHNHHLSSNHHNHHHNHHSHSHSSSSASSTSSSFSSAAGAPDSLTGYSPTSERHLHMAASSGGSSSGGGGGVGCGSASSSNPQADQLTPASAAAAAATVAAQRLHQQLLNLNSDQVSPLFVNQYYHERSQQHQQAQRDQQQQHDRNLFFHPHNKNNSHNNLMSRQLNPNGAANQQHHHLQHQLQHELGPVHKTDADDLDRIRSFIEQFKARRGALGLTQKQAAQCFRAYTNDRYAFSDNFVGHFEGFQFRPQTAMTIADSLAEWLEFAEAETRQGRQLNFMPGKVKETRKRKYEVIRIRDSAKRVLVDAFEKNRSPSTGELEQLSKRTNIPSRNIEIFFKNRRTSRQYHH